MIKRHTIEPIDPVRFISNHSSGAMGYEIARRSNEIGAEVTLVSGPSSIEPPVDCAIYNVTTADQMFEETLNQIKDKSIDIVFCVAAVCDYKPKEYSKEKIKKQTNNMVIDLTRTNDILKEISKMRNRPFLVGFAAETNDLKNNALQKLSEKGCDVLAANNVLSQNSGFNSEFNELLVLSHKKQQLIRRTYKYDAAKQLIDFVHGELSIPVK